MHAVLQQVFDSWNSELSGKPLEWCQFHPLQDERLWSAQEIVEHLALTLRSTSHVLAKRLEKGRPTSERSSPVQWVLQLMVLSVGYFPRGAPAPPFVRPDQLHEPPMNGAELIAVLRQDIDRMDDLLDQCRHRFGMQRVAPHFVLGPLRTDQWRRFHVVHMRHHLGQFRRLIASIGQPAAQETSSSRG
jgi:hypothetical protein